MALKVDINANTRQAQAEVKDLSKELDKYADSLDDMAKDAKKSGSKVEDALQDVSKEAKDMSKDFDKAGEKVEDSFRDMVRSVKKLDDAVDDVNSTGGGNLRKLGDTGEEVSGELKQNLGETFSSFRGDLEDIPQIAQDVFGGLAGSVGTLTASLGLGAAAAGIGLIVAGIQNLAAEEEARTERVHDWAQAYRDAGADITDTIATVAAINNIYDDTELYDQAIENAKNWGVTVSTAANAMAGDKTALALVNDSLTESERKVSEAVDATGGDLRGLQKPMRDLRQETIDGRESLNGLNSEMSEGDLIARQNAQSLGDLAISTGVATGATDNLGNSIYRLPDGKEIVLDANTGKAYEDVNALDSRVRNVPGKTVYIDADTSSASSSLDHWISQHDGQTIKVYGKYVAPSGWDS